MLNFLGCGGAFDYKLKNTSAYFIKDKTLNLIDCGESVFSTILEKEILKNIDNINIFITHLHSDHCGSLGSFISYIYAKMSIVPTIIYDEYKNLEMMLNLGYVSSDKFKIIKAQDFKEFSVKSFTQDHEENSFGYLFEIDNKIIYYSGDAINVNIDALNLLNSGKIDYFYHDATVNNIKKHINIEKLYNLINEKYRDRVYIMHYNEEVIKIAKSLNLKLVEER